eukprot:12723790-Heterocapsa_arctica.AAC.1
MDKEGATKPGTPQPCSPGLEQGSGRAVTTRQAQGTHLLACKKGPGTGLVANLPQQMVDD